MKQRDEGNDAITCEFSYAFQFKKTDDMFDKLWHMKTSARESLKDWLLASEVTPKLSEVCANACSELIENCIKYTRDSTRAAVNIHVNHSAIIVETSNSAERVHKDYLASSIQELQDADDPKTLFVQKLLTPSTGGSHLGLIKILMETKGGLTILPSSSEDIVHLRLRMEIK